MVKKMTLILGMYLLLGTTHSFGQGERPMNFLFIAVDDLKPLLGCFGDTIAITPHIDAIAANGITFTRAYCQQALCAPSRASLMTSRYPDQTRVWDLETLMREMDPGIVSLPQYLKQKGYRTAGTGKIFDYRSVDGGHDTPSWSVPFGRQWDEKYYNPETGKPAYFYAGAHARDTLALLQAEALQLGTDPLEYVKERYFPATENADVPVDAYVDGAIANVGIEMLGELAATGDPFFLAIGFNRPHLPFNAPSQFWDLYERESLLLAPFQERAAGSTSLAYHDSNELRSYTGIPGSGPLPEGLQLELIHGYYAAASYIDFLIGQVVVRLTELGLQDNTAIVLWGDHGWHLGDHQLWCKHSNFEEATHAPLVISYPGQPNRGAHSPALTEFTDIAPTICDLAGLEIPAFFEGESLTGIFRDTLSTLREGALSQYPRNGKMGYSLRTGRYRYTRWVNPDGTLFAAELYDYQNDPLEQVNQVTDPGYARVVLKLDSMVSERITVPSTQEKILFRISGSAPGGSLVPLKGASIMFAQESRFTDELGTALYTHHAGASGYRVEVDGYIPFEGILEVRTDTLLDLLLMPVEPIFLASVCLADFHTGRGLIGASIQLNGNVRFTDLNGRTTFSLAAGTHSLLIEKENYPGVTDSVRIAGDTTLCYKMEATHAEVKIWLRDGTTPVNLASVTLNGREVVSNSLGISRFDKIPTGEIQSYIAEKEGYGTIAGSLVPLADTSLHIQMERLTRAEQGAAETGLRIRPNPARNYIRIDLAGGEKRGIFEITDMMGRIMTQGYIAGPRVLVPIEGLPPGMYRIRYTIGPEIFGGSFIKQE